ncbi:MAG TPA: SDR family oxidoreductase [Polyangiaceae bacterium]|nr:SDR family oxidoreductase [Polyangiaceae bacterium]
MNESKGKSVVITGASSGIGRASALLLAERGMRVFAGVRKPADASELSAASAGAVLPIEIDVTDRAHIARAADAVREQLGVSGLDGLVNNAGIATPAPIEYMGDEVLRRQFEVNVFGQVAVTQAFLPLIRQGHGRIVNIGSVGSHLALPFGGALCASKAAFSMLSDALRLELRPSGIHVCLIEPGAIHTPAVDKTLGDPEGLVAALPPEGVARYGEALRQFMRRGHARESAGSPPQVVAEAVYLALTARRPRLCHPVGAEARRLLALPRFLPERLLDLLRLRILGLRTDFGYQGTAVVPAPAP